MSDRSWDFDALARETSGRPGEASRLPPVPPPHTAVRPGPTPTSPLSPPSPPRLDGYGPPIAATQVQPVGSQQADTQQFSVPQRVSPTRPPTPEEIRPVVVSGNNQPRWGWRTLLAFVTGGALTAAGFGVAQLDGDQEVSASATTETSVVAASPVEDLIVVQPPTIDTDEPVAFVAALLGPSVVQIETDIGLGSGVIYADGLILTNHHVVENTSQVRVRLSDGRTLEASVVGSDPRTDIAVVAAGADLSLPQATLALDKPLEVGELTVAIGSPFQLQQTVTSGIVSALNRPIFNGTGFNAMVQTDAAINRGNSGGALANRLGEVIGINTAIQTDGTSSNNAGIGFAMPITTAYEVAARIVGGESLEPGFLGVEGTQPPNGEIGVLLASVSAGSAADFAGLLVGDIVVSIDGAPVTAFEELAGLVQTSFPGQEIELQLVRDGKPATVSVVLGER